MMGPARRGLKIGETDDVWAFYDQRFKNCQQTACKLIAKAWVKVVEPKKQTNHPYTGSEERRPDWWPAAWGPSREEKVRHKEPDHLYKKGRQSKCGRIPNNYLPRLQSECTFFVTSSAW